MPMFKIFVGNLDAKVTVEMLKPMFEAFGELDEVILAKDEDGKSRGFAIVLYKDAMKGQLAIETLTGRKILGKEIVINEALKKGKRKLGPADATKPRGPFGPKFRGGPGAGGPRVSFGGRGGAAGGFSRGGPGARRDGATGGGPAGPGAAGGSRFSRNPRRGPGGPRPGGAGPGAGGSGGRPPSGPGGSRPPTGGPPRPPRDED
jgi:RNA recognition motif-containing protein